MSAVLVIGLLFPGTPMLILGIVLARMEAHQCWLVTWRLRREIQWAEEANERLEKRWKRIRKAQAKLLISELDQLPLSICIDGRSSKPFVYAGMQTSDEGLFPSWDMYHLTRDVQGVGPAGSTVAGKTLRAAGFDVPWPAAEASVVVPMNAAAAS